jgi:3-hydroxyisobutyrate dehydrogenase
MLNNDYAPGFIVDHFIKDMGIALDEARRMNICLPGLALVHQFYKSLQVNGGSQYGT